MTTTIRHHAYFGTMNFVFALTDPMIAELERLTDTGIGAIYQRVVAGAFSMIDLPEIIRLGLIGGGTAPQDAARLTDTYARNRPMAEVFPLALDILDARWSGSPQGQEVAA